MRLSTDSWGAYEHDDVNPVAEKRENRSSKRYEMSKWSFGDATLVSDWNEITVHCHIALYGYYLTKETIYNMTLEINARFPMCVYYFYYCCCKLFA